jgi:hypothetical protein
MSATENIALMKRWFEEVWNEGRMATVMELLDANATGFGQAGHGTGVHGPADLIYWVAPDGGSAFGILQKLLQPG